VLIRHGMAVAALAAAAIAAHAEPVSYGLMPEQTWVEAEVLHFGTSTIRARFGPIAGEVVLDREKRSGEVSITIDTTGVNTGFKPFDTRLREPDLLATAEFAQAWFVSRNLVFQGETLAEIRGEFTLRGISRPLTLKALRFGCREQDGASICGGDFEATFKRSDFGASFGAPLVADNVRLVVRAEGQRR
jgi:polyisoprenoid-binding protein YceI